MAERPYTVLSCGMSLDGYIDDAADERLVLSNDEDLDRVDAERCAADAILVGAATVRRDNPRLLVRCPARRRARIAEGRAPSPAKVTITGSGCLDPGSCFFAEGEVDKLVYCRHEALPLARVRFGCLATVVDAGTAPDLRAVGEDLARRGVRRLLVEGGSSIHTQLLAADLADELQLVVAPMFVGDRRAPRFVREGTFPWNPGRRAELADVRRIGDVVLLRYALSARFAAHSREHR